MTPTLTGRWQTRVALLLTVGAAITLLYIIGFDAFGEPVGDLARWKLPLLLGYVTLLGLVWDGLYVWLQSYRWDRDWPLAYQLFAGLAEGVLVFVLFYGDLLPGISHGPGDGWRFALHYGTVFVTIYLCVLGPMRVMFPRWRFDGGKILSAPRCPAGTVELAVSHSHDRALDLAGRKGPPAPTPTRTTSPESTPTLERTCV